MSIPEEPFYPNYKWISLIVYISNRVVEQFYLFKDDWNCELRHNDSSYQTSIIRSERKSWFISFRQFHEVLIKHTLLTYIYILDNRGTFWGLPFPLLGPFPGAQFLLSSLWVCYSCFPPFLPSFPPRSLDETSDHPLLAYDAAAAQGPKPLRYPLPHGGGSLSDKVFNSSLQLLPVLLTGNFIIRVKNMALSRAWW